jgi:hypothetical protein
LNHVPGAAAAAAVALGGRDRFNSITSFSEASFTGGGGGMPLLVDGVDVSIDIQAFVSATVASMGDQLAEIAGAVELATAGLVAAAATQEEEEVGDDNDDDPNSFFFFVSKKLSTCLLNVSCIVIYKTGRNIIYIRSICFSCFPSNKKDPVEFNKPKSKRLLGQAKQAPISTIEPIHNKNK